ncbi:hypothetical protein [Gilvibacter sediminis]|uniref:hypothetical protein n=1 Tax=Gilvibacter sediminis TaxID=379071 RepID=UPI00234FB8B3|nr:hypothetical protein [Gilvibacter sediminis]MDC7998240.1 hypothetical protein [Gilvibacter sediminis]
MKQQSYISRLASLFLMGLLLFPVMAQYVHVFDLHEHEICLESKVHMHEDAPVCELDDLRLPLFDDLEFPTVDLPEVKKVVVSYPDWISIPQSSQKKSAKDRAPPLA